ANYFANAFLKEKHPKLANLMLAMATGVYIEGQKNPQHTSLEDFERLYAGVGVDNFAWYQCKFWQKGAQIYDAKKLTFLADVKRMFPLDEKGAVTPEVALERLEKISPGITAWATSLK